LGVPHHRHHGKIRRLAAIHSGPQFVLDRFYTAGALDGQVIELDEAESRHLSRVLRKQVGEQVSVFDGRGSEATAEVVDNRRRKVQLRIISGPTTSPPRRPRVSLVTAVPKGDRVRWLVEKATELGIASWTPLHTARSVVDPGASRLDRLRHTVIAACKQSGRNDLLEINEPIPWPTLVERSTAASLLVADPAGAPARDVVGNVLATQPEELWIAIGPEGGLTPEEVEQARCAGAQTVGLGGGTLRIETAAIAVAAWVLLDAC
jgi:16S rRNA (uracil1498-N3)-methyltransferase